MSVYMTAGVCARSTMSYMYFNHEVTCICDETGAGGKFEVNVMWHPFSQALHTCIAYTLYMESQHSNTQPPTTSHLARPNRESTDLSGQYHQLTA